MRTELSCLCQIIMGQSPASDTYNQERAGLPFFQGNADFGEHSPKIRVWCSAPLKRAEKGNILISVRAPIGAVNVADRACCIGRGLAAISSKNESVLQTTYLYFYLLNQKENLEKQGTGSTFKAINKTILEKLKIRIIELSAQQRRVSILFGLSKIISLHKKQLEKLDDLVKARFVEMFGDWHQNPNGLSQVMGKELFVFSSGKFLPETQRKKSGIPAYGGNGVAWYTNIPLVLNPTIIIGRVGAQCGNVHLASEPVWITDNAIYIKCCKRELNNLFLKELMIQMNFHQYADYSGQPKITQKPLEEARYIVPNLELQNAFADFVQQVDKSKVVGLSICTLFGLIQLKHLDFFS